MARHRKVDFAAVIEGLEAKASLTIIAKKLKVSVQAVSNAVRILALEGFVFKKKGSFFVNKDFSINDLGKLDNNVGSRKSTLPTIGVEKNLTSSNQLRVAEPHKFGEWFTLPVDVSLSYPTKSWELRGGVECASWTERDFTIIRRGKRLEVWLKNYAGLRVEEQIVQGRTLIRARAERFAQEQGISLTWGGYCGGREWTLPNRGLSKEVLTGMNLKKGEEKDLGRGVVGFTDGSHKGLLEFKDIISPASPTSNADEYGKRLQKLVWEAPETLEKLIDAVSKSGDAIVALKEVVSPSDAIKGVKPEERRDIS